MLAEELGEGGFTRPDIACDGDMLRFFCLCHNRTYRPIPIGRTKYSDFSDSTPIRVKNQ
jgi:hypothetical protein